MNFNGRTPARHRAGVENDGKRSCWSSCHLSYLAEVLVLTAVWPSRAHRDLSWKLGLADEALPSKDAVCQSMRLRSHSQSQSRMPLKVVGDAEKVAFPQLVGPSIRMRFFSKELVASPKSQKSTTASM
jgi:hypothetical protein